MIDEALLRFSAFRGEIAFEDLILGEDGSGIPFRPGGTDLRGLDCKALSFIVLRRAGIAVPEHALIFGPETTREALDRYLGETDGLWEDLGDDPRAASALGDLVVAPGEEGPHLMPVARLRPWPTVLSIERAQRGVRGLRASALRSIEAVLRFRG